MYSTCKFKVKTLSGLTQDFESKLGVKQGCNLSPTLSNIYQNDLHEIFDDSCDPIALDDIHFNSLSWADYLLLMSTSHMGLQRCLDKLEAYCYKWGLSVNADKTKCMVFSSRHSACLPFYYNNLELDFVKSFKYLGIIMSHNGKFTKTIEDRVSKAERAICMLRQVLASDGNVSIKLALSLFDKQISPILLYGCSIWGIQSCTNYFVY